MDAIILAGGRGTRLRSVVADRPKPMAEVAGRPFLEWLTLWLRDQGVRRAVLATGHMGEAIAAHFGDGAPWGMELEFSREMAPRGTAGAARLALDRVTGDRVVVLNGDSWCPFDLALLTRRHTEWAARVTLWTVRVEDCRRFGSVDVAPDGRVTAFHEKSPEAGSGVINAGVYLCERRALEDVPADRQVSLETEVLPSLVGHGLHAVVGAGPFLDIGTPETYAGAESVLREASLL